MTELARFQISGNVTLDGSGNGTIRFAPSGTDWYIDRIRVSVSTQIKEAKAIVYLDQVGDAYAAVGTISGSTGDTSTDDHITRYDGQALFVQWLGGDAGATANAILSGQRAVVSRGFRSR